MVTISVGGSSGNTIVFFVGIGAAAPGVPGPMRVSGRHGGWRQVRGRRAMTVLGNHGDIVDQVRRWFKKPGPRLEDDEIPFELCNTASASGAKVSLSRGGSTRSAAAASGTQARG